MEFTDLEYETLTDILQTYREFEEEKYGDSSPEELFTKAQLRLFKKFDVVSIRSVQIK